MANPILSFDSVCVHLFSEWQTNKQSYKLSNENKIAYRAGGGVGPIIYSSCASYTCGHTIKFKVTEFESWSAEIENGIKRV